jgi:hypothetical protein
MAQEEMSIFREVIVSVILSKKVYICTCVQFRTVSEIELFHCTVHCTDEQHAMSSHELQSALMLTVEFSLNNKYGYLKQYVISVSYQQFRNCTVK